MLNPLRIGDLISYQNDGKGRMMIVGNVAEIQTSA